MGTKDLGPFYVTRVQYLDKERHLPEVGWTAETDYPWRMGRCLVFRIPFTHLGLGLGLWGPEGDEEETLVKAAGVRYLGPTVDVSDLEPEY